MKTLSVLLIAGIIGLANINVGTEKFEIAPEISLMSNKGEELKLSNLRGNVVLIDFWAAWCKPCIKSRKSVTEVYEKFGNKSLESGGKFEIFSVSLDRNKEEWLEAIDIHNLDWSNHVSELKGFKSEIVSTYKLTGIPNNFLINQEGVIIAKNVYGEDLERILAAL